MSEQVGWGDISAGNFTFLSSDGATIIFVVVDKPVMMESVFAKKPQERVGVPCVTDDGFRLFVTGKRVARKIAQFEEHFKDSALMVTRHGVEHDQNATYECCLVEDKEKVKSLFALAKKEWKPELLTEAIEDAEQVMKK